MWHDPPKLRRSAPLNVVFDGNSLFWGEGATNGQTVTAQALPLLQARFADVVVSNIAISGQTWRQMDGLDGYAASDVDGAFLAGRTNVLVAWETTNSVCNAGRTGVQAAADAQSYVANRLALHPDWRIVLMSALPRQSGPGFTGADQATVDARNAEIAACDAILRARYRTWGARACVDVRCAGSPFRFADYAPGRFAADPQLWAEGVGSRTHLAHVVRPTFAALVQAEEELGSLFHFVEKVAGGDARLAEIGALLWHCLVDQDAVSREKLGEAIVEIGLAAVTPVLKTLVTQILKGR